MELKNKEKILKAVRGKRAITFYFSKVFSGETESMGYSKKEREKEKEIYCRIGLMQLWRPKNRTLCYL